jgi:hypothetical protein
MNPLRSFFIFAAIIFITASTGAVLPVFAQTATSSDPNAGVASSVASYFSDIPVMIAIAKCESGPRQFASDGSPLYAGTDNLMVGVFQLDKAIHYAPALALGFDITTLSGNLSYARYLYGAEGTEPWISSFDCWDPQASAGTTSTVAGSIASSTPLLTLTLSLGSIDPQVLTLQQLLNQAGFTLATSGPGSPGNETTKFGALTYAALKKFQCAENIACSGDEATTGYGLLNAPTRAALLAITTPPTLTATSTTAENPTSTANSTTQNTPPNAQNEASTTITATDDSSTEIASLESRLAALVVIVNQLEAEIAARTAH